MAVSDWRYGICPHCGYINFYVKPSKFPICKCCDYEDPIIITNDERHDLVVSIKASINEQKSNEELADIIDEALREKYVYGNEHFSKKAYNDMLEYTERKEEEARAFFSSNSSDPHTPKCPTCGSTDLRKVSVGAKAVSVGLFGIFSQKVKKTWHCNSCGYEW